MICENKGCSNEIEEGSIGTVFDLLCASCWDVKLEVKKHKKQIEEMRIRSKEEEKTNKSKEMRDEDEEEKR